MLKMTKSTFLVCIGVLYANCIRVYRYIDCGSQRFLNLLAYEYRGYKQTQKQTYLIKLLNVVVLLYMYLLYLYKEKPMLARVYYAYDPCMRVHSCRHKEEAIS